MKREENPKRRRRGVILTPQGLKKLIDTKTDAEFAENSGNRYTLEDLSERTGLAVDTLMKVFACDIGVDKQTLKACFRSFEIPLESSDFSYPLDHDDGLEPEVSRPLVSSSDPELPEGQVPLGSIFYLERPPIEAEAFKTVLQPGSLIRIKGARRTGKTSLLTRLLNHATQHQCRAVSLSFQLADRAVFQDSQRLLQWFCASVGLGLGLPNQLAHYWDDLFGNQVSCKMYFEQYLLAEMPGDVVLGLDDVDRLFQYPDLAGDFFGLLRTWHEEGKNRATWRQLHLVVVHSTDVYIPLDANRSPFNVGLPVDLQPFTLDQVTALAQRYEIPWSSTDSAQLMVLVGGQPYLIKKALYHIWHQDVTLADLLATASQPTSIYYDHLLRQLWHLQRQPRLLDVFQQLLTWPEDVNLSFMEATQLQSLGLIGLRDHDPHISCRLYQEFFGSLEPQNQGEASLSWDRQ